MTVAFLKYIWCLPGSINDWLHWLASKERQLLSKQEKLSSCNLLAAFRYGLEARRRVYQMFLSRISRFPWFLCTVYIRLDLPKPLYSNHKDKLTLSYLVCRCDRLGGSFYSRTLSSLLAFSFCSQLRLIIYKPGTCSGSITDTDIEYRAPYTSRRHIRNIP